MKKILFHLLVACASVSACQIEEISKFEEELDYNDVFYASLEMKDTVKTSLDEHNNIRWSAGDQLIIFKKTSLGLKYQIQDSYVGETSGYFSRVISGSSSDDFNSGMEIDHNVAYYPYSDNVGVARYEDDYVLDVTLPSVQTYANETFGNGYFPMAAVSASQDITFRNVLGGIKLQFKGVGMVTSVKFEGKNNEKVSGDASIIVFTDEGVPQITMGEHASATVVLDCGDGVQLNETTATEFIISLPPYLFENGFTITVTDPQGNEEIVQTSRSNEVLRSSLLVMPEVVLKEIQPKDNSIDLSASGTANSYIVSAPGAYRFTTVKGNGSAAVGTIMDAEVLWESFGTDVQPAEGDLVTNVQCFKEYIRFEVPDSFNEGNALIAAKDASGKILWSWHIWLTDQPLEHEYPNDAGILMDRNLGATSATPGDITAYGLLYQWGRKDPFLNTSIPNSDNGVARAASTGEWSFATSTSDRGTLAYSIKNPTTFIVGSSYTYNDWLYSDFSTTRWSTKKTIYDPCPPGWRVPNGGSSGYDGVWAVAGFDNAVYDEVNYGVKFSLGSGADAWYPSSGWANYYNGTGYGLYAAGINGYYWSATFDGFDAYGLSFTQSGVSTYSTNDRGYANAVRCFKENSGGVPSLPAPNPPNEGDYVDRNGVNHGQGVSIDGVVWAPVNEGALTLEKYGSYYEWFEAYGICPDGWRLPYKSELEQLAQNSYTATVNGVNGRWFSGSKNTTDQSSAIFLPYAGDEYGYIQKERFGYYWSANAGYYRNKVNVLSFGADESPNITGDYSTSQAIPVRCVLIQESEMLSSQRTIDGLTWATKNAGAETYTETGNYYTGSNVSICPQGWRVPTFEDFKALNQNYSDLVTVNGVSGRWFSGSNKTSNSSTGIFLPMAGYQYLDRDGGTRYATDAGWYKVNQSWCFYYDDYYAKLDRLRDSDYAMPVRCVKGVYNGPLLESPALDAVAGVTLDGLTWSTKNVGAESVYDYGESFTWNDALNSCPEGWRLPNKDEMQLLILCHSWDYISNQCGILCFGSRKENNAIFLPTVAGAFYGNYWTSSQSSATYSSYLTINSNICIDSYLATQEYAVRCVKGEVDLGLEKTEGASYTVTLKPEGATYGWQKSTVSTPNVFMYDGLYESTNKGKHSTESVMYIDIVGYETFSIYVRNNGESGCDYMKVSQLDKSISGATSDSDPSIKTVCRSKSSGTDLSAYTKVEYTGIDKKSHRITIVYKKDDSESEGSDRGFVMIPLYQ